MDTHNSGNIYNALQAPQTLKKEDVDFSYNEDLKKDTKTLKEFLSLKFTNQFQILNMLTNTPNHSNNRIKDVDFADYNRYCDIQPYKHSAIKLSGNTPVEQYINADYIHCPFRNNAFIATQGPIPSTFIAFWRMVWEKNTDTIFMLCKEMEKN